MAEWTFPMMITDHGAWQYKSETEKELIANLHNDSDRATGIIGGAIVDIRLEDTIKFRTNRDKKIEDRLFQPSGALGSFATKIDLAYMMGLISKDAHADLIQIKEIRNAFAHNTLEIKDFKSPSIRDRANNLSLIDTLVVNLETTKVGAFVFTPQPGSKPRMAVQNYNDVRNDPKRRYITTIALFSSALIFAELPKLLPPYL